jgi:hypothetical protein
VPAGRKFEYVLVKAVTHRHHEQNLPQKIAMEKMTGVNNNDNVQSVTFDEHYRPKGKRSLASICQPKSKRMTVPLTCIIAPGRLKAPTLAYSILPYQARTEGRTTWLIGQT